MKLSEVRRPPWPVDHPCNAKGCGHRMDEHASPIVEDGRCLHEVAGCPCGGWDPLTDEEWATILADARARQGYIGE